MIVDSETVLATPFVIHEPMILTSPFVFNVPHAGALYPKDFVADSRLDEQELRASEDAFVDRLFSPMSALGAPVMCARFPRAYLDVNREPYELEPRLFSGPLPVRANTRSVRVKSGLGVIPRVVADGCEIYQRRLSVEEGLRRIEYLHHPYHAALGALLDRARARFGRVILIDCHSMPSRDAARQCDVVLGNRFGASCANDLMEAVDAAFRAQGYVTARNKPYAGGYITEFYGRPAKGRHALQIELSRGLYMDEEMIEPLRQFGHVQDNLWKIFSGLVRTISSQWDLAGATAAE